VIDTRVSPLPVSKVLVFALAVGALFVALLASSASAHASVLAWGKNSTGQLGIGTTTTTGCECVPIPTPVVGLDAVTQVVSSEEATLALLANGSVMGWGGNQSGVAGTGNPAMASSVPVPVPGLTSAIAIATGMRFSLALLADGTVDAWGYNGHGLLGVPANSHLGEDCDGIRERCRDVPRPVPDLTNVVAIAAGEDFALALLADGTVKAWGRDDFNQLGVPPGSETVIGEGDLCGCISQPTTVPGVSGAVAISAERSSGFALLADGTVKAWGGNQSGNVLPGTSTEAGCKCLAPLTVPGLSGVTAIASNGLLALARLGSGSVRAWGVDDGGSLGDGMPECECRKGLVTVAGLANPAAIAAGGDSFGLALLANGAVEGWGAANDGQLGPVASETVPTASPVSGVAGASGIAAGTRQSFALIGPSQALKVAVVGTGTGAVSSPHGILCSTSCENSYPQGQVERLDAAPAAGSGFAGFTGACGGTAACQLRLDTDQSVTATFGPPKGTAFTKATVISKKKSASFSFSAPGAITGYQCELIKPRAKKAAHKPKHHKPAHASGKKAKHAKPHFSSCASSVAFKHLKLGRYTFKARALDILGADPNPAVKHFVLKAPRVKKPRHHKH
jgi:alpha-tubulin suppressor-like RCC1 family protein